MQVVRTRTFAGPNLWSALPVVEAYVRLEQQDRSACQLSELVHRLHRESGISLQAFQPLVQQPSGEHLLAFEFEEERLIQECLATAVRLCQASSGQGAVESDGEHRRLVDMADDVRLGPSSRAILRAAAARGIPFFRMNDGSLVQFGEGAFQRRTWTAETDATSAIAESIAGDKQLTRSLLAAVGVNVPMGRSVASREDAWAAALEVGVPVAVKPRNSNHAVGVSLDLNDQQAVMAAYDWACQAGHTTDVLVEQYIRGDHHRLLVIGGKLAAAAKGQREFVLGDGQKSIRQLVADLNSDPRRGENYTDQLQVVKLDDAMAIVLEKQGLNFDSIPEANLQVLVHHVGDLIEDCTAEVHPTTREVAVLAAKTIGLDIAGMDVVATDIRQPLGGQRGCIIEVNAGPSLTPHVQPLIGSPQPVGEAVVDLLYPQNRQSKLPIVVALSSLELEGYSRKQADQLTQLGFRVGYCNPGCKQVDQWPIQRPSRQFRALIMHPQVTAIVLEIAATEIAERGLPCCHAEWFVVSANCFVGYGKSCQTAIESTSPSTFAALNTMRHLLASSGDLLIIGSAESAAIAEQLSIPSNRVHVAVTIDQAVARITSRIQK